ncbi:F0F1 ATP synthase subunit delta [Testudinibacter sp. TR-2022]|uniref:F0F1 ATP synthase subunit delta n=1 Tax=Testudinibacter sp. TR-2022 TaxID=2585029 RepID=UPI001119247E|nr:F0F1 ATP synthase subunit delta [Testudinibacter sp. TR-2022]TNH02290.1 F0F1 ATP synthase subunit delta [Pasteurellaceae bacterium Phil31]TNH10845.1 F0F1 ATP synthase subunit delta [Testudinibacter sp. TR-2022]TNH12216.1 F0F1 ATP synthase subunit delta [Testudinibacter sp. TR-2022]TNH15332.1 F0F1 ATP synthase subunit delta [Testudinibacter sp. TR-2022]TNH17326.1 F0F1 ATP synthase subunit delta [Testudinibacter sp. TR-2022]
MSEYITVARPYAKAAFDFAVEQNRIDAWQAMLGFVAEVAENDDIKHFLKESFSPQKVAKTFIDICGDQLDQYGQNFIRLMAENKRVMALPEVFKLFQELVDQYKSLANVEVISAEPLTQKQQQNILQAMEKRLARKVKLNCSIDKNLIGGAIIRTDDLVIDGSSRGQLNRLANELQL